MSFLGWIKNRNQQPSVGEKPPEQKPENAKQMYAREAQEKPTGMDRMPADQVAKVDAIKGRLEQVMQASDKGVATPSPVGEGANPEAQRQNMTGQDKTAPALSPTSGHTGQPATDKAPASEPDKSKDRGQTLPRPQPSWER